MHLGGDLERGAFEQECDDISNAHATSPVSAPTILLIYRLFPVKSDKNFWAPKPFRPPYCLRKLNQQQTILFHLRLNFNLKPGSKSSRLAQLTRSGPVSQIAVQTLAPSFSCKRVWPLGTCRDKQTHLFFKIIESTYESVNTWIDCTTK